MRDGLGGIGTVAIIGGTSDIGLAIARSLKRLGAKTYVLAARSVEQVAAATSDLPNVSTVPIDLSAMETLRENVDALFSAGDVDVVVLAAGVLHSEPDADQVAEMALVNGAASVALLSLLGERLRDQGHGHLVVLSSMAVVRPRPSNYWYGASKTGLDFAARGLADTLAGSAIDVSIIRPGFVHTKMTEGMQSAPFSCKPEAVGDAVASVVRSGTSGVIWVPGVLRWVAILLQWLPKSLLARLDS